MLCITVSTSTCFDVLAVMLVKPFSELVDKSLLFFTGDFDVPSSREEVDRDSVWNQWLRNEIHSVFVNALEDFKVSTIFPCLPFLSNPAYLLRFCLCKIMTQLI